MRNLHSKKMRKLKNTNKLFKEITVWKEVDDETLVRYRCLMVLPDHRYCVKSADFYRQPLDEEERKQQEGYYLESLFDGGLDFAAQETYETLEEAIAKHDEEFENFFDE
jgi:hypothetical protein